MESPDNLDEFLNLFVNHIRRTRQKLEHESMQDDVAKMKTQFDDKRKRVSINTTDDEIEEPF